MQNHNRPVIAFFLRYQLIFWVAITVIRGVIFTFTIPPWQHPDEPAHFEHVLMIAQTGRIPEPNEVSLPIRQQIAQSMLSHDFWRGITQPELTDKTLSTPYTSPLGIYTLSQPRLYYVVAALWLQPWLSQPTDTLLYIARLLSVLLSLIVVVCGYLTARMVFVQQPLMILATTAFIVLLPGYTDIMSAVNNDALVNALAAILFFLTAIVFMSHLQWWSVASLLLLICGVLGLCVITKATGLILVAAVPVGLVVNAGIGIVFLSKGNRRIKAGILALAVILILSGAVAVLILRYLPSEQWQSAEAWLERYLRANIPGTIRNLLQPQKVPYSLAIDIVFRSFWAIFGWRHVYLAPGWYLVPTVATLVATVGVFARVGSVVQLAGAEVVTQHKRRIIQYLAFCLVAVVVVWVSAVLRSQADGGATTAYQSHGRYAYIALVPFALLFSLGIRSVLPQQWRDRGILCLVLVLIAFDAVSYFGFLYPYYHR